MLVSRWILLAPFFVACALSTSYVFLVGANWGFDYKAGAPASGIFTCLLLSCWAAVPYLALLPIALRETRVKALAPLAVFLVFTCGAITMHHEMRHLPGDEGLYLVVPAQQVAISAVILLGWLGVRALFRWADP